MTTTRGPYPPLTFDDRDWTNWSGDLRLRPLRHYRPSSLEDLAAIVRAAEAASPPRRVHAVGSSWSFCGPSATTDFVVETHGLNRVLDTSAILGSAPAVSGGVVHVEAGIQLHDLVRRLDDVHATPRPVAMDGSVGADRWALATMGGSSGQTLAGAISTGTHGADVHLPPLADAVRALHLVGPGGRQVWIEGSNAVTDERSLRGLYPSIEVRYDDDLLAAATVALGSFGMVYSLLLDVVPQYALKSVVRRSTWGAACDALDDGLLNRHRAVQIVIEPYPKPRGSQELNTRRCYVTTRDEADETVAPPSNNPGRAISAIVNAKGSLLHLVASVSLLLCAAAGTLALCGQRIAASVLLLIQLGPLALVPLAAGRPGDLVAAVCASANKRGRWQVTAAIVRGILAAAQKTSSSVSVSYAAMAGAPWVDEYYRGHSIEMFFDADDADWRDTVGSGLLPVLERNAVLGSAVAGWFSLRFTGATSALLGMQKWPHTVCIEVAVLRGIPGSVEVLRELEAVAVASNGLVHWGQQNDLDAATVEQMYPRLPAWRAALADVVGTARTFENDYCRQRGLVVH